MKLILLAILVPLSFVHADGNRFQSQTTGSPSAQEPATVRLLKATGAASVCVSAEMNDAGLDDKLNAEVLALNDIVKVRIRSLSVSLASQGYNAKVLCALVDKANW